MVQNFSIFKSVLLKMFSSGRQQALQTVLKSVSMQSYSMINILQWCANVYNPSCQSALNKVTWSMLIGFRKESNAYLCVTWNVISNVSVRFGCQISRKQKQHAETELELVLNETYISLPLFMYISLGEMKNKKKINFLMIALQLLRGLGKTVLRCSLIGNSSLFRLCLNFNW